MPIRAKTGSPVGLSVLLAVVLASTAAVPQVQSDRPPRTSPRDGEVVVYGCVEGSHLVPYLPEGVQEFGRDRGVTSYRLLGPKALLQQLREEHEGQLVEIAGRVRKRRVAEVPEPGRQRIGDKTTVFVGQGGRPTTPPDGLDPVTSDDLEVTDFVVIEPTCPGKF